MAMIICPECGKPVPETADKCPHCDFPIADYLASVPEGRPVSPLADRRKDRIYSQKLMMVIASGIVLFILYALSLYRILGEFQFWPFLLLLLCFCVYTGPILFCTLKRKKPAIFLSSLMLVLFAAAVVTAVLTPEIDMSGAWISTAVTLLSLILILLYSILGSRNWNMGLWVAIFLSLQAVSILTPRAYAMSLLSSAYERSPGITELLEVATFVVTCLFFVTGYSPDRWYRKSMW